MTNLHEMLSGTAFYDGIVKTIFLVLKRSTTDHDKGKSRKTDPASAL
jgi:hypothetical protein